MPETDFDFGAKDYVTAVSFCHIPEDNGLVPGDRRACSGLQDERFVFQGNSGDQRFLVPRFPTGLGQHLL